MNFNIFEQPLADRLNTAVQVLEVVRYAVLCHNRGMELCPECQEGISVCLDIAQQLMTVKGGKDE